MTVIFEPGQLYTIPNEEYRQALINEVDDLSTPEKRAIYNAIALNVDRTYARPEKQYVVPSIEGITTSSTGSNAHVWNKYTSGITNPNANTALLTQITRATTILSEVPIVSNGLASMINFIANEKISELFKDQQLFKDSYIKMDMDAHTIKTIFSSDQFISSMLMQDPRYMMIDDNVPTAAEISVSLTTLLTLPPTEFNFGGVIALMAFPIPSPFGDGNTTSFQNERLRSSYASPSSSTDPE
ncbi:hypothetical protein FACS1894166_06390 [Bacilli bacterium]|nr:hypothetical protein FACS1894166_06390 [Bacilli bacterium]